MVACELSVDEVVFTKRMGCKLAESFCMACGGVEFLCLVGL
jgi:hypothetical protein